MTWNRTHRLGVVAVTLALGACSRTQPSEPHDAPSPASSATQGPRTLQIPPELIASGRVAVAAVERKPIRDTLRLAGEVVASPTSDAEAGVLVAGRVASIEVAEGARVEKGQILAWVFAPEVAKVAAEVLRARARAEVAEHKLARQRELEEQNATSRNAIDEAAADERVAKADLFAARTQLASLGAPEPAVDTAGFRPFRVPVRSPIAGVVVQQAAVVGAPVTPDRSMFHVVGAGARFVRAMLPETAREAFDPEHPATLVPRTTAGDSRDRRCAVTLRGEVGVIDEASRSAPLRFEPEGPCDWLLPGGYADVIVGTHGGASVDGGAVSALAVARGAVVEVKGIPTLFVAKDDAGHFEARSVRVGSSAGEEVVIEAGLEPGERIVVRGSLLLKGELLRAELGGD